MIGTAPDVAALTDLFEKAVPLNGMCASREHAEARWAFERAIVNEGAALLAEIRRLRAIEARVLALGLARKTIIEADPSLHRGCNLDPCQTCNSDYVATNDLIILADELAGIRKKDSK